VQSPILAETIAAVIDILGPELDKIAVERAAIGLFFTGVNLTTGHAGACATPIKTIPEAVCCPSSAMAMPFYRPAEAAREVVPAADVLLVTGTTLLNDTPEDLLSWARPEARATVVGPTIGLLPDAFLARGADYLGGVRITTPTSFSTCWPKAARATISSAGWRKKW
jgi:uncharacterized protein (DUF4213/DUF364 family)